MSEYGPVPAVADDALALAFVAVMAHPGTGGKTPYDALKETVRHAVARDAFDATVVTVLGGAFLFYMAERGQNPKVSTFWDALVFVSTCLSVGYADVFARTPAGKAIAAAMMTIGPAMSAALLEAPSGERDASDASNQRMAIQNAIVDKLDAILIELRTARSTTP